ncbi:Sbal_3080 family lipoprotein [Thermodesulfobacteriota bacterium]
MNMLKAKCVLVAGLAAIALLNGCAIQKVVHPLPPNSAITEVCILENPKVTIPDFLQIVQDGIERNGLRSRVYREIPTTCSYVLEYVAFQRWDFTLFMSEAEIKLYHQRELVGSTSYKLPTGIFGMGGINPEKWNSTKEKLDPLLDELFQHCSSAKPR